MRVAGASAQGQRTRGSLVVTYTLHLFVRNPEQWSWHYGHANELPSNFQVISAHIMLKFPSVALAELTHDEFESSMELISYTGQILTFGKRANKKSNSMFKSSSREQDSGFIQYVRSTL